MGRAGRRLARTPSQGTPVRAPRGLLRGKRPLYPRPATPKVMSPAIVAPPRRGTHRASQPGRAALLALAIF
jgi:hypothetical protein